MSNTKLNTKLINKFENIVKNYNFIKKENFPWYIQENEEANHIFAFTFFKYDKLSFKVLSRINRIESVWDKYYFEVNPTQKNSPYTVNSSLPTITKYFPELGPTEDIQIDFNDNDLLKNFEFQIQSIIEEKLNPFFSKIENIEKLNAIINSRTDTFKEVLDFMVGAQDIPIKKLIIAKLCKSDNLIEIYKFAKMTYEQEIEIGYNIDKAKLKIEVLNKILNENS